MITLELVSHPQCPCTSTMRARLLDALHSIQGWWAYRLVSQQTLPAEDVRRRYPAPTVLHADRDLFGLRAAPGFAGLA